MGMLLNGTWLDDGSLPTDSGGALLSPGFELSRSREPRRQHWVFGRVRPLPVRHRPFLPPGRTARC